MVKLAISLYRIHILILIITIIGLMIKHMLLNRRNEMLLCVSIIGSFEWKLSINFINDSSKLSFSITVFNDLKLILFYLS